MDADVKLDTASLLYDHLALTSYPTARCSVPSQMRREEATYEELPMSTVSGDDTIKANAVAVGGASDGA
jgi:hypothetical protein